MYDEQWGHKIRHRNQMGQRLDEYMSCNIWILQKPNLKRTEFWIGYKLYGKIINAVANNALYVISE